MGSPFVLVFFFFAKIALKLSTVGTSLFVIVRISLQLARTSQNNINNIIVIMLKIIMINNGVVAMIILIITMQ